MCVCVCVCVCLWSLRVVLAPSVRTCFQCAPDQVAKYCLRFGMRVVGFDPIMKPAVAEKLGVELVRRASHGWGRAATCHSLPQARTCTCTVPLVTAVRLTGELVEMLHCHAPPYPSHHPFDPRTRTLGRAHL